MIKQDVDRYKQPLIKEKNLLFFDPFWDIPGLDKNKYIKQLMIWQILFLTGEIFCF
jgi:hypothetical protein